MKTIKVEKTFQKEIHYKKRDGTPDSFMKYSVASENVWYDLKGVGKENVKEGDTITGLYTEADWSKGGKSGVNRILELVEPEIQIKEDVPIIPESSNKYDELLARVEALEENVFGSSKPEEESTNDDSNGLPY